MTRSAPWLWAVNGSAGVPATGSAVLVSIETSLNFALWVGAIGYALVSVAGIGLLKLGAPRVEPSASLAAQALGASP